MLARAPGSVPVRHGGSEVENEREREVALKRMSRAGRVPGWRGRWECRRVKKVGAERACLFMTARCGRHAGGYICRRASVQRQVRGPDMCHHGLILLTQVESLPALTSSWTLFTLYPHCFNKLVLSFFL